MINLKRNCTCCIDDRKFKVIKKDKLICDTMQQQTLDVWQHKSLQDNSFIQINEFL